MHRRSLLAATAAATLLAAGGITAASASTTTSGGFEGFDLGEVNAQQGWTKTGPYDVEIVDPFAEFGVTDMGSRALRLSNATVSGSFSDQTFSAELADEAGEPSAEGDGSGGTRQSTFTASFSLRATTPYHQEGLYTSISPDRGDGARMSYLRLEDQADGVHVFFSEFISSDFVETDVATLTRADKHTIGLTMLFVDGPSNDVVQVGVDGEVVHTGTSWEDYFREFESHATRTVDSLLFREGGAAEDARPALEGEGFLVDDVELSSASPDCAFSDVGTTLTLLADCTTDQTVWVPDGYTLDGDGHTITAVDPAGGHFTGAVVQNAGEEASVVNLGVTAALMAVACDAGAHGLAGIRFDNASGTISGNAVSGVQEAAAGRGCQEGDAIEVVNDDGAAQTSVTVTGNEVADYQKTGVLIDGPVNAVVSNNAIEGYGPTDDIAQNGVQVSDGATALVDSNTISDSFYSPKSYVACGVLVVDASGVKIGKDNVYSGNEKNTCTYFGKGGTYKPV